MRVVGATLLVISLCVLSPGISAGTTPTHFCFGSKATIVGTPAPRTRLM